MKKFRLFFAVGALAAFSLASCSNECQNCVNCGSLQPDVEVCEDDFNGNDAAYDLAISSYELAGCDCD